jgi:hypothetical protein
MKRDDMGQWRLFCPLTHIKLKYEKAKEKQLEVSGTSMFQSTSLQGKSSWNLLDKWLIVS